MKGRFIKTERYGIAVEVDGLLCLLGDKRSLDIRAGIAGAILTAGLRSEFVNVWKLAPSEEKVKLCPACGNSNPNPSMYCDDYCKTVMTFGALAYEAMAGPSTSNIRPDLVRKNLKQYHGDCRDDV